jgi:hypothetical protein
VQLRERGVEAEDKKDKGGFCHRIRIEREGSRRVVATLRFHLLFSLLLIGKEETERYLNRTPVYSVKNLERREAQRIASSH